MTLNNLKIGPRLGLAFAAIVLAAALVVAVGISRLSRLTESLSLIGSDRIPKVHKLIEINDGVNLIARELRNALIWDDPAKVKGALDEVLKTREEISTTLDALTPTLQSDEGRRRLAEVVAARQAYVPVQQAFIDLLSAGKKAEAETVLSERLRPAQLNYITTLDKLRGLQVELIDAAVREGEADYASARLLMFSLLAATMPAW